MQYCDHALSVVRQSSLTFHISDFSSETAERNSMKHDRKQDLIVLYQACFFGLIRQTRWPPWPIRKKRWHIVLRCTIYGPLGPLFYLGFIYHVAHCIGKLLILYKPSARYLFIDNEIQYSFWLVHWHLYFFTYLVYILVTFGVFLANPEQDLKEATRRP